MLSSRHSLQIAAGTVHLVSREHVLGQLRAPALDNESKHLEVGDRLDRLLDVVDLLAMIRVASVDLRSHEGLQMHLRNGHRGVEALEVLDAREDRRHRVVVPSGDRIELVVMAAGATHRQAHEGLRRRVDLLVHHVVFHLDFVLLDEGLGADGQKSCCDNSPPIDSLLSLGRERVPGELLEDEFVEGRVLVQRVDDIVAIAPRVRHFDVVVQSGRVGVARYIEPVSAPLLSVARRTQQLIDETRECVRSPIR